MRLDEDPPAAPRLALAAIVAVGLLARLRFLFRPLQVDEAYSLNEYAARPLWEGLGWYTFPNNHLLNTALVHGVTRLLGEVPWAVRLPALVAGLLLIPATSRLVADRAGRAAGLIAAAIAAASAPLVNYSTNARGYGFVVLATVVLLILARRLVERGGRLADWAAFVVVAAVGFFAIPTMLYPFAGVMLLLGWRAVAPRRWGGRRLRIDRWLLAGLATVALTLALYMPVFLGTGWRSLVANPFVVPRPLPDVLLGLPGSLVLAWRQWHTDWPLAAALPLLGLAILAAARPGRGRSLGGLLLVLVGTGAAIALAQRVIPYDRVWLFLLPVYAGCVGAGLVELAGIVPALGRLRVPPIAAAGLALGLALPVVLGDGLPRETRELSLYDAEAIAALLEARLGPDDAVAVYVPGDAPLKAAFRRRGLPVEYLYDYRIARARRVYVATAVSAGQTPADVLRGNNLPSEAADRLTPIRDFGTSRLDRLDR